MIDGIEDKGSEKIESSLEEGVVAHVLRRFILPDKPGSMTKGLGFNPIIVSTLVTSIDIDGKKERAHEITALVPVVKVQGKFEDLNFAETIEKTFGHPLSLVKEDDDRVPESDTTTG